jgi:hypothetical protein
VDCSLEDLLYLDEGEAVPLVASDVVQKSIEDVGR